MACEPLQTQGSGQATGTGASFIGRFDTIEGFERKKSAALLFTGAVFGFCGFGFAFGIGLYKYLYPHVSEYHKTFKSGHGYFPSTVSEMVHDPSDPAGKCFFAFEFIGAFLIFQSWYPWTLRNVYMGDDVVLPFVGVSWSMFRQFIPPLGMMLVACVTTTPFATANELDLVTIGIHLLGAVMLFAGYGACEALSLGWCCFSGIRPEEMVNVMSENEVFARTWCLIGVVFWYVLFCVLQVVLVLGEQVLDSPDVWVTVTITERTYNATKTLAILDDTASGAFLFLKVLSYASEVFCGLMLIFSFMAIWYYCEERHVDLEDTLHTTQGRGQMRERMSQGQTSQDQAAMLEAAAQMAEDS